MNKKVFVAVLFAFVCIQFVRPNDNIGIADTEKDIRHRVEVPDSIMTILKRSCYDCHSDNTVYPWYGYINPARLWLNHHVEEGKAIFNFSDFSVYSNSQLSVLLKQIGEATEKRAVPLKSYLFMHKDARLSEKDIHEIVAWTEREKEKLDLEEAKSALKFSGM